MRASHVIERFSVTLRLRTRPQLLKPTRIQFSTSPRLPRFRDAHRWVLSVSVLSSTAGLSFYLFKVDNKSHHVEETSPTDTNQFIILSPSEHEIGVIQSLYRSFKSTVLDPIFTAARFLHLLLIFMPVIVVSPMILFGSLDRSAGERQGALWWYTFLVWQMERAGPTFIKLGQWAGARTDLFPSALCDRLGSLHSHGKPHSFRHTRKTIEKVFKKSIDDIFQSFDHEPIGVGAIAQVYKATLKPEFLPPSHLDPKRGGNAHLPIPYPLPSSSPTASVAIKVLHPSVEKMITRDLSIMRVFATVVSVLPSMQWLSLLDEVDTFGKMMHDQLDMRHEASNLLTFEQNFGKRKTAVTFPRPVSTFSSKEILVEEFQNALPLESFLATEGSPFDEQIAQLGLDAFLSMLLLDNFVHSDLHPGNIMVKFYKPSTRFLLQGLSTTLFNTKPPADPADSDDAESVVNSLRSIIHDPAAWNAELQRLSSVGYQPEIVFIDAGLVTELNDKNRQNFLELFTAIAQFDGYLAGKLMVERCKTPQHAIDPETFALKLQHLVLKVKKETFSLGHIKISDILTQVLKAVRQHHVRMEGDFINTVLSVLLLEGIGRQLDPNLDLFASSLPILRQLGRTLPRQRLTELPGPKLGAILKLWVWAEARSFASAAFLDSDNLIRYDLIAPNI